MQSTPDPVGSVLAGRLICFFLYLVTSPQPDAPTCDVRKEPYADRLKKGQLESALGALGADFCLSRKKSLQSLCLQRLFQVAEAANGQLLRLDCYFSNDKVTLSKIGFDLFSVVSVSFNSN